MANFNLTGQKIKNTYGQVAQVNDDNKLVDGLGNEKQIVTSSISNFDTEVSRSAAEAGFGQGSGGGVSEGTFNAYTSSNDTRVDSLTSATSSYLTSVPSGTVSGSSQVSYSGISGVPSGIVSSSTQLPQIGVNQTNISSLTSATGSYLTSLPSGVVSGSSQVSYTGITNVPSGIVSSSDQILPIATSSITNFDTEVSRSAAEAGFGGGGGAAFPFTGSAGISGSLNLNSGRELIISDWTGELADTSILIGQTLDDSSRVNPTGDRNIQIGYYSRIVESGTRNNVVVIGADAEAAQDSVTIGKGSRAVGANATALGTGAEANGNNAVSIGDSISVSNNNEISINDIFQYNNGNVGSIKLNAAVRVPTTTLTGAGSTVSVDGVASNYFYLNNNGSTTTISNPTNIQDGATYTFKIDDPRNITWGAAYKWPNGVVPTPSSGSDIISFVSIGGTNLYGTAQYNYQ